MANKADVPIQLAHAKLDWFERNPKSINGLTWRALEDASGVCRTTLWRDKDLYERYKKVCKQKKNSEKPLTNKQKRRLTLEQRIRKLEAEKLEFRFQRDCLIETMLAIFQHFGDQLENGGIDVLALKKLCDNVTTGLIGTKKRLPLPLDAPDILTIK